VRPFYFVTGGFGSLGREVIPRLLSRDRSAEIAVLLRARDPREASARLGELGRYLDHYWPGMERSHLYACRGDAFAFRLGLSDSDYRFLTGNVTHILHGAASIDLGQSLENARMVNVGGTREVLRLAERRTRLMNVADVSTAFVAGNRDGTILERELWVGQAFRNAYEQSKCEAERIIQGRARDLPVTVFRPSVIVGDSRDGHTCNFATLYRVLRMIAHGVVREVPAGPEDRLDIVTVDYVAEAIAELIARPRRSGAVYHLTAGPERSIRIRDLVKAVRAIAPERRTTTRPGGVVSHAALSIFLDYVGCRKAFDDSTTRADLGPRGPWPERPGVYLPRILAFCLSTDWGRSLPWEERQWQPAA
jgi:thioester reductase-like protein